MYLRALNAELALERLQMTRAVASGIQVAFSKPGAPTPTAVTQDIAAAAVTE